MGDYILVISHRDDEEIVPCGDSVLGAGDMIEILGIENELSEAELRLSC